MILRRDLAVQARILRDEHLSEPSPGQRSENLVRLAAGGQLVERHGTLARIGRRAVGHRIGEIVCRNDRAGYSLPARIAGMSWRHGRGLVGGKRQSVAQPLQPDSEFSRSQNLQAPPGVSSTLLKLPLDSRVDQ